MPVPFGGPMRTKRSGCAYGNGRMSTLSTTVNIAVFAPMPNASVSTASAANPGDFRSIRKANLRSCPKVSTRNLLLLVTEVEHEEFQRLPSVNLRKGSNLERTPRLMVFVRVYHCRVIGHRLSEADPWANARVRSESGLSVAKDVDLTRSQSSHA